MLIFQVCIFLSRGMEPRACADECYSFSADMNQTLKDSSWIAWI